MGMPQRDGRPSLDISPADTPDTATWAEKYETSANELNHPVPQRKGGPAPNGWTVEPAEALPGQSAWQKPERA